MSNSKTEVRQPIVLAPGQGRAYPMGRISAVFKADGPETGSRYAVSEWWLEPRTQGPGAHCHGPDSMLKEAIGSDWKGKLSPLIYIVGVLSTLWIPWVAQALYVLAALLWLVPDRRIEKRLQHSS